MNTLARILVDYVIEKGAIKKNEREIYEYGFLITLEITTCIITCFIISLILHTLLEGILFFIILIPLRSYAGGLHLNNYWSCFLLSCSTFFIIMLLGKYCTINRGFVLFSFFVFEIIIYNLYPVENKNRTIDTYENRQFKKRLKQFIVADGILAIVLAVLGMCNYLYTITITLVMLTTTMVIGKYKNN